MKPTIDEQIEAVECVRAGQHFNDEVQAALAATLKTLEWVKRHAPTIKAIREEFPGSKFVEREESDGDYRA